MDSNESKIARWTARSNVHTKTKEERKSNKISKVICSRKQKARAAKRNSESWCEENWDYYTVQLLMRNRNIGLAEVVP